MGNILDRSHNVITRWCAVSCDEALPGYLTKNRVYCVLDVFPEDNRVAVRDDNGKECWVNVRRVSLFSLYYTASDADIIIHEEE